MNAQPNPAPQDANEKLATLKMTLKSDSGFRSQSDGDRISANQWRDIMLVVADAEAYRKMRAAHDLLEALEDFCLSAECAAGCDESASDDEMYSEILSFGGSTLASSYSTARHVIAQATGKAVQ